MQQLIILEQAKWPQYELLDSGNDRKLERFGTYVLNRPQSQALWIPSLPDSTWEKADATLTRDENSKGNWNIKTQLPEKWQLEFDGLKFWARKTSFGHVGVFPEQNSQWLWIKEKIKKTSPPIKVLSLFGYTGIANLFALREGAEVTFVDASKPAISWAIENLELAELNNKSIRWIVDDGLKFVKRELRRGNHYDAIIMDPPKFGRGPKGEVWKFAEQFVELLKACREILSPTPLFVLVTAYTIPISAITLGNCLSDVMKNLNGNLECGECILRQSNSRRLLPTSLFARWSR